MLKFVTVIGARPQFIKAAPLSRMIRSKYVSDILDVIVHTGQHYDKNMSNIFFEELEIPKPDYHLGVGSSSHGKQTAEMLVAIEEVLLEEKPDCLVIYGDTNSTIAGSLAASKLHIPIAHIEAGLRSFNMLMPEEQNRILTDHLSNYLLCPTETAIKNLRKEGIYGGKKIKTSNGKAIRVANTGDIMLDAVLFNKKLSDKNSTILQDLKIKSKNYILSTIHRAENTNDINRLKSIFNAFSQINHKILLALHPRTKKYLKEYEISPSSNVQIIAPVGYLDMIQLEKNAKLIMTDSGGIQKEAYFLKVPCVTLRDETEWVETVKSGWNEVVGADENKIINAYYHQLKKKQTVQQRNYFGDGNAAKRILEVLING